MLDREEVKATGKAAFKANYWKCILVALLLTILAGGTARTASSQAQSQINPDGSASVVDVTVNGSPVVLEELPPEIMAAVGVSVLVISVIAIILRIFVFNPLKIGCYAFFKNNVLNPGAPLDTLMEGFKDYGNTFLTLLLADIYTILWSMLFIIPGLIKMYSYRLVPYIMRDNPGLTANETITLSRELMNGNKMKAFIYDLSFIGWILLDIFTLGIVGLFWVHPYKCSSDAALYLAIINEK